MFLKTETPRLQETGQAYSEVGWETVWMRPGRLELQEKGPEQKHIWMSQGLWVECISSWGEGGLHWSMHFVLLAEDLDPSSFPEPFLNFPPCNPSSTGIPKCERCQGWRTLSVWTL